MRQVGVVVFIVALLVVIGGLIFWAVGTTPSLNGEPEIVSFTLDHPDMVVVTRGEVASVAIFGVPDDEEGAATSTEDIRFGDARIVDTDDVEDTTEWRLGVPATPLPVVAVYAEAYDEDGTMLDRESLPYTGPAEVRGALWSGGGSTSITLGVGESGTVDDIEVTLNEITEDARCSPQTNCPNAVVLADVTVRIADEDPTDIELSTDEQATVGTYILQILEVSPEVTDDMSDARGITQSDYRLRILVFREAKL